MKIGDVAKCPCDLNLGKATPSHQQPSPAARSWGCHAASSPGHRCPCCPGHGMSMDPVFTHRSLLRQEAMGPAALCPACTQTQLPSVPGRPKSPSRSRPMTAEAPAPDTVPTSQGFHIEHLPSRTGGHPTMGLRAQPFRENCLQQELVQTSRVTAQSYKTDPYSRLGVPNFATNQCFPQPSPPAQ